MKSPEPKSSQWKKWYIKAVYSHGVTEVVSETVKARSKYEAEQKAAKIVRGKALGFIVYMSSQGQA